MCSSLYAFLPTCCKPVHPPIHPSTPSSHPPPHQMPRQGNVFQKGSGGESSREEPWTQLESHLLRGKISKEITTENFALEKYMRQCCSARNLVAIIHMELSHIKVLSNHSYSIADIRHFWYTTTLLIRSVKSTPKNCVKLRQNSHYWRKKAKKGLTSRSAFCRP